MTAWLDDLLKTQWKLLGVLLPARKVTNVIGNAAVTIADNPVTGETDFTINTAVPANNSITYAKIQQMPNLSVLGNPANSTTTPTAIPALAADLVLRNNSANNAIGFGTIAAGGIASGAVTLAKHAALAALSVIGNATNSAAIPTAIAAATDGHILRRLGTAIDFGKILTSMITGTATNNNATAGDIGEYVSSTLANGSATALVTATAKTITSISLTAGDWDVSGNVGFTGTATASTVEVSSISLVNNTRGSTDANEGILVFSTGLLLSNVPTPTVRISIASTTTIYLVGYSTFSGGTMNGYGTIRARRAR